MFEQKINKKNRSKQDQICAKRNKKKKSWFRKLMSILGV